MEWLKRLFGRRDDFIKPCECNICYDAGVVRLPTGNKHFQGLDIYRRCPCECKLTPYGRMKSGLNY